jgi:hypothetical protein
MNKPNRLYIFPISLITLIAIVFSCWKIDHPWLALSGIVVISDLHPSAVFLQEVHLL